MEPRIENRELRIRNRESGRIDYDRGGPASHFPVLVSHLSLVIVFLILGTACGTSNNTQTYAVKGRIVSIEEDRHSAMIDHEEIKGFMPAMTMLFTIKDPSLLEGLTTDDLIKFELTVTKEEAWINQIEKIGHAEPSERTEPTMPASQGGSVLKPGEPVPDFSLIDQDGRSVRLSTYRGKPVAMTFIFTRCPMPEYCPRFTNNFTTMQKELAARFGDRFHLVSVSFDPAYDTPGILKEYGRSYGADFRTWSFLTGSEEEIQKITYLCGVNYWNDAGSISHTSACVVISPSGTLYKLYRGNTWKAEDVMADLATLLNGNQVLEIRN